MNVQEKTLASSRPARRDEAAAGGLRIVPLGGLGHIGKNMMLIEYGNDLIVVDAGSMFPTEDTPGIDLIIPDCAYLLEHKERLRGILLTHGHEDHIGALPFLLRDFGLAVPIYGADLTLGVVRAKLLDDNVMPEALSLLHEVNTKTRLELGCFQVEFFQVNHSFPSSMGVSIQTPLGRIVHTGDFKFDDQPIIDEPLDEERLARWGREGVLLLMADSTNAEETMATSSESAIEDKLQELFEQAPGRIFLSTFASNTSRVQQAINLARRNGRRVGWVGRSMFTYGNNAIKLEYLDILHQDLLSRNEINEAPDDTVCVLITGSQGEPRSALNRLSQESHKDHEIRATDTVIISASPIPGNEVAFYSMVNRLFWLGADVIYSDLADIHVSGHGSQRENQRILSLLNPRYFMPVHGEYRHLVLNARMAIASGMDEDDVFVLAEGGVLELGYADGTSGSNGQRAGRPQAWYGQPISLQQVVVDGYCLSDSERILKERRWLQEGGVLVCVITYDPKQRTMKGAPRIFSRGFLYPEEESDFHKETRTLVTRRFSQLIAPRARNSLSNMELEIQRVLNRYCRQEVGRRPVIMVRLIAL